MREILFRGKRTDNGEWVQGCFVSYSDYDDDKVNLIFASNGNPNTVIPETVGQYTGLCDKNGTKIFEGDILKFSYNENDNEPTFNSVEWKSDRACFGYAQTADKFIEVDALHCEVVGNVYDTPELLKGGDGK